MQQDAIKQDIQDLTSAMVEGFQAMHQRFEDVDERLETMDQRFGKIEATLDQHGNMIDHIAGRVDDLWVEAGAQTKANRRFEARIDRLEQHLGMSPLVEDLVVA